jgi:hypothetical protein
MLIGAALLVIAGYGIAAHHNTVSAAPPVTLPDSAYMSPAMVNGFTHLGDPGVDRPFLPSGAPAITREDAINAVETSQDLAGQSGYTINAKYGLFTAPTETKHPDGTIDRWFDNTPIWAVRVDGIHFAEPDAHHAASTDHLVFIVDPTTGELRLAFSG